MVKLTIATMVLLGLIGSVRMQDGQQMQPQQPQQQQQQPFGGFFGRNQMQGFQAPMGTNNGGQNPLGQLGQLGSQLGGQLGGILNGANQQQGNGANPLSGLTSQLTGLLGNNGGQQQPQQQQQASGLAETIRQLPYRGIEMLQNLVNGVRNMLPGGMGRQGLQGPRNPMDSMMMNNGGQFMPANGSGMLQNGPLNSLGQLTNQLPSQLNGLTSQLGGMTNGLTNGLTNGRLPEVSSLTQQLSNTAGNLQQGLSRTLSGILPSANTQGAAASGPSQQMVSPAVSQ